MVSRRVGSERVLGGQQCGGNHDAHQNDVAKVAVVTQPVAEHAKSANSTTLLWLQLRNKFLQYEKSRERDKFQLVACTCICEVGVSTRSIFMQCFCLPNNRFERIDFAAGETVCTEQTQSTGNGRRIERGTTQYIESGGGPIEKSKLGQHR